jgi:hypothetical protein
MTMVILMRQRRSLPPFEDSFFYFFFAFHVHDDNRFNPVRIVVTPTKRVWRIIWCVIGTLQHSSRYSGLIMIPCEAWSKLPRLHLQAPRRRNIPLTDVIMQYETYHVIFVDPEQLEEKTWRAIRRRPVFRDNPAFGSPGRDASEQ